VRPGSERMCISVEASDLLKNDNILDAAVCALAGADFLRGETFEPEGELEKELAHREGWIWCRKPRAVENGIIH
jgi:hypothetical protein